MEFLKMSVADMILQPFLIAWLCVESVIFAFRWMVDMLAMYIRIRRYAVKFPTAKETVPILGDVPVKALYTKPELLNIFVNTMSQNKAGVAWLSFIPVFYVWHPHDIARVLCNPKFQEKSQFYRLFETALGKGLLTASAEVFHRHFKIIGPTFHTKILDSFVPTFNSLVDVYIDILRSNADGKAFDISHKTGSLTMDIVLETAMDTNLNIQKGSSNTLHNSLKTIQDCIEQRLLQPWFYPNWIYALSSGYRRQKAALRIVYDVLDRVVRERKKLLKAGALTTTINGKKRRLAFLDHVLLSIEAGAQLSDQELSDEIITVGAAGADTTYILICYTFFELARHPNIQDKVVEELESLYDASLPTIDITPEDLNRLTYLEMVLKETLRLHTPVPAVMKLAGEDIRLATCDLVIPADAQVAVPLVITHRCAEYYPDPEKFDPERFSAENSKDRDPFAFLPFSTGQRVCPGRRYGIMEAKIAVAKALWNYEFTPEPGFQPVNSWGLTLKTDNGVWLRMHTRRK